MATFELKTIPLQGYRRRGQVTLRMDADETLEHAQAKVMEVILNTEVQQGYEPYEDLAYYGIWDVRWLCDSEHGHYTTPSSSVTDIRSEIYVQDRCH